MPHKIKKCFLENLTFEKMLEAHDRAKKNKMNRYETLNFDLNMETNVVNIVESIKNGTYKIGNYREFVVREPKTRIIKALPYVDRVVHQWYIEEFIKPYIVPKFIKDSYACICGRGTHKAVDNLQSYMKMASRKYNKNYYILKMDIKKFFYNIDQEILFEIMNRYISDKYLLNFTKLLIFSIKEKVGIPIGNYTSQFFASIYLHQLDMYVKNILRKKYYVRYMDDFILLIKNKEEVKETYAQIKHFLNKYLKLELNDKSRYYPSSYGIDFCGYRIWNTHKLVRKNSIKKMNKKVKRWNKLYSQNKLCRLDFVLSFNSWLGHIKHANSYNLKRKTISKIDFISYH